MRQISAWASGGLALLSALAAGCSSAGLAQKACIPELNCDAIDTIEAPPTCSTCSFCEDNWGACNPGGSACKRGLLDLDREIAGCESAMGDAPGQWLLHSTGESVSYFTFNGGRMVVPMNVSALALSADETDCVPTFDVGCAYTVHALQLEIADFSIPESSWSGGVATLNGPIAAVDAGAGVVAQGLALVAFDVEEGRKRRIALDAARVEFRLNSSAGTTADVVRASMLLRLSAIDFGGYQITDLFFNGDLSSEQ